MSVLFAIQTPTIEPASWSVVRGLLTADVGDGPHQAHIRCDVPTVADMPDLKGVYLQFGSSSGNYDLISEDVTESVQHGANEFLVTGLASSTTYYWRVRFIDSEGNLGSYCSEQTCTSAAAWSPPSSPTEVDQSDFPLTMSGGTNYKLTENVSGNTGHLMALASNCTFDFNGHTITGAVTEGVWGVVWSISAITNCRLFDSTATTPGSGGGIIAVSDDSRCIYFHNTPLSTGNVISDIFLRYEGLLSFCVEATDGISLGGLRVFNVKFRMIGGDDDGYSLGSGGFQYLKDVFVYGCDCDMDTDDARCYVFSNTKGYAYIWGNDASIRYNADITTGNHGFFVTRHDGHAYVHGNAVKPIASATRNFFADGPAGKNVRCNWNTLDLSDIVDYAFATGFDIRNDDMSIHCVKNVAFCFNTVEIDGNELVYAAFRLGGEPWGGEGADTTWEEAFIFGNTVNGIATNHAGLIIDRDNTNVYLQGNTWNCAPGFTGYPIGWGTQINATVPTDTFFSDETINGASQPKVHGPPATHTNLNWHVRRSWTAGGDSDEDARIDYDPEEWVGFEPSDFSIPTPTGMGQVTGVH